MTEHEGPAEVPAEPRALTESAFQTGPLQLDRSTQRVTVDGAALELTPIEYKLLLTLVDRPGRVQSRVELLQRVWDAAPDIQTRTVDMHVKRLRTKLGSAGTLIETVRGFGYRLNIAAAREGE